MNAQQLSARTLQVCGLMLITGSAVFWAITGRESALFVGAGVTLATLGWIQRAFVTVQERLPRYDPPELPEETAEVEQRARTKRRS